MAVSILMPKSSVIAHRQKNASAGEALLKVNNTND